MVRSMYSGVAGMKAHQTKLDVIGNNIANVNTYGFKSSRATFRDMYYQQLSGATGGTTTRGGTNPASVGYGAQVSSIDLQMSQSSMTSTGNALDVAITGEGFLQVMDADGNIYYTKAGMLDVDPATGAVIDSNGNFVLGTGATNGKLDSTEPGSDKIFIKVDAIQASAAECKSEIGGRTLTITSSNQNTAANVGFVFSQSTEMPAGQRVEVILDSNSSVMNVRLNAYEEFASMDELQEEINSAITNAYGGEHPGGTFKFELDPDPFDEPLTGAQIATTPQAEYEGAGLIPAPPADANTPATVDPNGFFAGGKFRIDGYGVKFEGNGSTTFQVTADDANNPTEYTLTLSTAQGGNYTGTIKATDVGKFDSVLLTKGQGSDPNDTVTIAIPGSKEGFAAGIGATQPAVTLGESTPNEKSKNLGLGKGTFNLQNGTEFKEQSVSNLTGISIGADGVITGTSANGLQVLGRIDLATFANNKGLAQSGSTYFTKTTNSGDAQITVAGENGSGAIKNSALELSNVDLSQEFSDMITTQRGFQACSRLITVSDTMLEELINLKR